MNEIGDQETAEAFYAELAKYGYTKILGFIEGGFKAYKEREL